MEQEPAARCHAHDQVLAGPSADSFRVRDLRRFLDGWWSLARVIEDRCGGQTGVLRGQACFASVGSGAGAGLVLSEAGRLRLGAHAGPAFRRHMYRFPSPGRAEVGFADGRPFHDLDLTDGTWAAEHRCGPDLYRGMFRAQDRDVLLVRWVVAGPRKDAILTSRYRRQAARIR